ncbi:MAG: hypothetical protein JSS99_02800 [Actinobacteria bacterium]|nr:hypothetical protein [Actinomycetota bacterium]
MNDDYRSALDGKLCSRPEQRVGPFRIKNDLAVPLRLYFLNELGEQIPFTLLQASQEIAVRARDGNTAVPDGYWWVATFAATGGFAAAVGKGPSARRSYVDPERVTIGPRELVRAGAIGLPPTPTREELLPDSSPRVLVACGWGLALGVQVALEQQWQLSSGSYALTPGERRTISYTETTGMSSLSSESTSVATSLGLGVSAGWGAISASVSMSLSTSASRFEQVSISSETTEFSSTELVNDTHETRLVLLWQLMQIITITEARRNPASSIVSAVGPTIPFAYSLERLPERFELARAAPVPVPVAVELQRPQELDGQVAMPVSADGA